MDILELHKTYIHLWPEHVRIDDGHASGSGFMFPTLSQVHHEIEGSIDHRIDHWGNVFAWSMFQACHGFARKQLEEGASEIFIASVPLEDIDQWVVNNLSGEDWVEERALYAALGSNNSIESGSPTAPTHFRR